VQGRHALDPPGTSAGYFAARKVGERMLFNRSKSVVGLDIGSSSIKLSKWNRRGTHRLKDFGVASSCPEAIVDGEIMDRQLVVRRSEPV
jgi:hypothetical protein